MGRESQAVSGGFGLAAALALALVAPEAAADEPPAPPPPRIDQPALVRPVPPPPPPPVSRTRMNCVGCAIAGGIVLGAGALHAVVGAVDLTDPGQGDQDDGRALLVLAGVHGLVGIPLLVAGLWPIETTGARAGAALPSSGWVPPSPPVEVAVGPLGGSFRVRF